MSRECSSSRTSWVKRAMGFEPTTSSLGTSFRRIDETVTHAQFDTWSRPGLQAAYAKPADFTLFRVVYSRGESCSLRE